MFVDESHKDETFFYAKVHEQINEARSCYIKESTEAYDDKTFARMMLLDACFIIEYILMSNKKRYLETTVKHLGIVVVDKFVHDTHLLENQIPFFILELLMVQKYGEKEGEEKLRKNLNKDIFGGDKHLSLPKNPLHLLEAYYLLSVSKSDEVQLTSSCPNTCFAHNDALGFLLKPIKSLSTMFIRSGKSDVDKVLAEKFIHSFRSVSDLKAKGIHFRRSNDHSLLGFKFKSGYFCAQLEVPVCWLSDTDKVFYSNLAAFEMCSQTFDSPVCDYIGFMKSLLDSPMDVKALREQKILISRLSDEEVVRLFKDIKIPDQFLDDTFKDVKDEIEAHYNNRAKMWLAEPILTYFKNPWKALALFAGILILVLAFLQTSFFTIKPRSTK